ncbi:hypothetical protein MMC13_003125 [Lambiella insularis]|nr:hypothetical protein [Lambiella insularis]
MTIPTASPKTRSNPAQNTDPTTAFLTNPVTDEKLAPHLNPTNLYIVSLRDDAHTSWANIAKTLNSNPKTSVYTPDAVYCRYARTKHRLKAAAAAAEIAARAEARSSLKRKRSAAPRGSSADAAPAVCDGGEEATVAKRVPRRSVRTPMVWDVQMDRLLREAMEEVQGEFWEAVAKRVVQKGGDVVLPAECAQRSLEM